MTTRDEVRSLVDRLSADDLETARRVLQGLVGTPIASVSALDDLLARAPVDDEPESEDERSAVEQSWQDYHEGHVLAHDLLVRERDDATGR